MKFITEFELEHPYKLSNLEWHMHCSQQRMGEMIQDAFGLKETPFTTRHDSSATKQSLEIEAFPMDKWVEFRQRFFDALPYFDATSKIRLENALRDLESFCKPSGDAMTNLFDQMEYRGSSSHCKACEDEAAGIKHIMAQKHTCKK